MPISYPFRLVLVDDDATDKQIPAVETIYFFLFSCFLTMPELEISKRMLNCRKNDKINLLVLTKNAYKCKHYLPISEIVFLVRPKECFMIHKCVVCSIILSNGRKFVYTNVFSLLSPASLKKNQMVIM